LPAGKIRLTAGEFLAWEIEQPERWELVDGECFAMAGGTDVHNMIAGNLYVTLRAPDRPPLRRVHERHET